jgi:hypothetical protein
MKKKVEKKLGKSRKIKGVISESEFGRVRIAIGLYDEERKNAQKHSAAVTQTVELIKQRYPMMRISETEVKRILATWRPRGSHNNLRIECLTYSQVGQTNHPGIEAQLAGMSQKRESKLPPPSNVIPRNSVTTYQVRFGERPYYPRHNRRPPKE